MKLDNRMFFAMALIGSISITLPLLMTMLQVSLYQFGRLSAFSLPLQMSSGVVLIYSGLFSSITCNINEMEASDFDIKFAWRPFAVIALLFLGSIILLVSQFEKYRMQAVWSDWLVVALAVVTSLFATFAYVEACRYFLRIKRLTISYRNALDI